MGYTKVVQYGNYTEIYRYTKSYVKKPKKHVSLLDKKRRLERNKKRIRFKRSIYRSRVRFFRLVHHNNVRAKSIHFLTLTFAYEVDYKTATRSVSEFFRRVKRRYPQKVPLSYISVPELTKKGRYHFHVLVYNLCTEASGIPLYIRQYDKRKRRYKLLNTTTERITRNLQRQFQRGYIDIGLATYVTDGLAGYMAKYMAKSLESTKNETRRGYNCSRNIDKTTETGDNQFDDVEDYILDGTEIPYKSGEYDTMYFGNCNFTYYKKITK